MNIKRAKQEIENTIQAYLEKDSRGDYLIPVIRQRPILLMGPPGIGKTQIMEQVARDCRVGLVSYTITHHTRQSAVGLPFISEKSFAGKTYSVTEYTMSEIIAAVYEKIEATGIQEGILFIDEINCVSETLAPTMLQFLQNKTFGNQKVPSGWIIVAAGNPPEYNKSVRDFDIVTLDRVKKIDVEENYEVWKEYAYKEGIHPAVISYLELKKNHFYRIETTVDGKLFATPRGWEDLSQIIQAYGRLSKTVDRDVVHQYIQHWKIAKDFANYLVLYEKYKKDYGLTQVLEGRFLTETAETLRQAPFDEKLSVIGLLIGKLSGMFKEYYRYDQYLELLHRWLKAHISGRPLPEVRTLALEEYEARRKGELLTKDQDRTYRDVIASLDRYQQTVSGEQLTPEQAQDKIRAEFAGETSVREDLIQKAAGSLEHAFAFIEAAFGGGQEMVVFVTELNTNFYSVQFIRENGSDKYNQYNKGLLFDEAHREIIREIDQLEQQL